MKPILRATHTHDAASAKQSHRLIPLAALLSSKTAVIPFQETEQLLLFLHTNLTWEEIHLATFCEIHQHDECSPTRIHSSNSLKVCFQGGAESAILQPCGAVLIHLPPSKSKAVMVADSIPLRPQLEQVA